MCAITDTLRRRSVHIPAFAVLLAGVAWFAGCKDSGSTDPSSPGATRLNGGGATFVDPLMQKWAAEYKKAKGITIDYIKSGSGDGIRQMTEKNNAFGCSDAPMNKKEIDAAKKLGGDVLNIPITMGSVAVIYNVPGIEKQLKLSGSVVADIYLGKIKNWNDAKIAKLNDDVKLPDQAIVPVRRAEGSGTSFIFTHYLSKANDEFAKSIGASKDPKWPKEAGGVGQNGNDGVAGFVQKNAGAIGYVELFYATSFKIPFASLRNKKGQDVAPTAAGVIAAAEAAMKEKAAEEPYSLHEHAFALTDCEGDNVYPICGMSFLVIYKKQPADKGKALRDFLKWATTDGQQFAEVLAYAPLPKALAEKLQSAIDSIELAN